jgi:hypothetical protein
MTTDRASQDIEALKKRHRELDRQKTTAEANQKTAEETLQKLKEDALASYGTDDLDQLRQQLAEMKCDNERRREQYQQQLDAIEAKLREIEREYQAPSA